MIIQDNKVNDLISKIAPIKIRSDLVSQRIKNIKILNHDTSMSSVNDISDSVEMNDFIGVPALKNQNRSHKNLINLNLHV